MPRFLSELSPEKEIKQFGFTVYDAETGEVVRPSHIKISGGNYTLYEPLDEFVVNSDGYLCISPYNAEDWRTGLLDVPREGRYIIFFSDCSWMRY